MTLKMGTDKLAILGGQPLRKKPFRLEPRIDQDEERMVLDAIRKNNFSRYIGSSSPDIEELLVMSSAEAAKLSSEWNFLGGENVRLFAAEFAEKFKVKYAIPINSATSGLSVALAASGIGPRDEVIVPALSFTATGTSALMFNSIPVFVDVDPKTFCIDPVSVKKKITSRTKAILPVHLLGNSCDMDALMQIANQYRLKIIEDCAQSPGVLYKDKYVGAIGDAGIFSFQQSKNITTGEGGMIITDNPEIARRVRLIMNHGEAVMEDHHSVEELANTFGFNFRMPELCAALGRAQLKKLDLVNQKRNENFQFLVDHLDGINGFTAPYIPKEVTYVCHIAGFLYDFQKIGLPRDLFLAALRAEGIPTGSGYIRLMYQNPFFLRRAAYGKESCPWFCAEKHSDVTYQNGQCPVAEDLIGEKFLWFYHIAHPSTLEDMRDVVSAVKKVLKNRNSLLKCADEILNTGAGNKAQGRILQ